MAYGVGVGVGVGVRRNGEKKKKRIIRERKKAEIWVRLNNRVNNYHYSTTTEY